MVRLAAFLLLMWTGPQLVGALVFEIHIKALEGRTVTLPCRAPNRIDPVKYLEWSRPDQKMAYIFLYRDQHVYPDFQDRAFKDRVDLLDKEMREGEVSLVLKNSTADDSGVYECRVVQAMTSRQKRAVLISEPNLIIKLRVVREDQIHDTDDDIWINQRRYQEEDEDEDEDIQQYLPLLLPVVAVTVPLLALTACKFLRSLWMISCRSISK